MQARTTKYFQDLRFSQSWRFILWSCRFTNLQVNMETARSSETLVSYHIITWCHNT